MNAKSKEFIEKLSKHAEEYILECISNEREVASSSGKVVRIKDRHIPTIDYFLNIWLPLLKLDSISRSTYYEWMKSDDELKSDTTKKIDELFKSLAKDIVANEGKGIFYAKNALGMHDKQHVENKNVEKFDFDE